MEKPFKRTANTIYHIQKPSSFENTIEIEVLERAEQNNRSLDHVPAYEDLIQINHCAWIGYELFRGYSDLLSNHSFISKRGSRKNTSKTVTNLTPSSSLKRTPFQSEINSEKTVKDDDQSSSKSSTRRNEPTFSSHI